MSLYNICLSNMVSQEVQNRSFTMNTTVHLNTTRHFVNADFNTDNKKQTGILTLVLLILVTYLPSSEPMFNQYAPLHHRP